jgi:predicted exporter
MRNRTKAFLYCLVIISLAALAFLRVDPKGPIDLNILSLLPTNERDVVVEQAAGSIAQKINRNHNYLIFSAGKETAKKSALIAAEIMKDSDLYSDIKVMFDGPESKNIGSFYFPYRYRLVDIGAADQTRDERLVQEAIKQLYSPMGGGMGALFPNDPFFLFSHFLSKNFKDNQRTFTIEDGMLIKTTSDLTYVYIQTTLRDSPFNLEIQEAVDKLKTSLLSGLNGESQTLTAGIIEHAIMGSKNAEAEIALVGGVSILGILIVILLIFRSITPVLGSLVTIILGLTVGFSLTLLIFGQVHIITLVAGGSLIGISIDYSSHFFADVFRQKNGWSPSVALDHIWQGIFLGLITSVLAFSALLIAPFPGLKQLAVFSIAGLLGAFGAVIFLLPLLTARMHVHQNPAILSHLKLWVAWWQLNNSRSLQSIVIVVSIVLMSAASVLLKSDDDVRMLQAPAPEVLADETQLKSLLNQNFGTQFILVEGATAEEVLQNEEYLIEVLSELDWPQGNQPNWLGVSSFIPSIKKQENNLKLVASLGHPKDEGVINRLAESVGLSDTVIDAFNTEIDNSSTIPLTFNSWFISPILPDIKRLWVGDTVRGKASIVLLRDGLDSNVISAITGPIDNVRYVDNVAEISQTIKTYREKAVYLLIIGYVIIAATLFRRYGASGTVSVVLPPFAAVATTAMLLVFLGEVMNLFTLVGLILVLGIGIDYTLFYREARRAKPSTMLAIFLSMSSTVLAFGLLSFSSILAIHSFGITVLIGITIAFLLAPMAGTSVSST